MTYAHAFKAVMATAQRDVHHTATEKGWWDDPREFGTMIALVHSEASEALEAARLADNNIADEWYKYTPPAPSAPIPDFAKAAVARLAQVAARGYMSPGAPPPGPLTADENGALRRAGYAKPEGVPSELADIVIRAMDIAEFYGIDLGRAILEKMEYNQARPYKHGGKKF